MPPKDSSPVYTSADTPTLLLAVEATEMGRTWGSFAGQKRWVRAGMWASGRLVRRLDQWTVQHGSLFPQQRGCGRAWEGKSGPPDRPALGGGSGVPGDTDLLASTQVQPQGKFSSPRLAQTMAEAGPPSPSSPRGCFCSAWSWSVQILRAGLHPVPSLRHALTW